jgi:predicted negative regulator of RcsB-dependent stress response
MEDNINKEFELKDKVLNFATNNKKKFILLGIVIIFLTFLMTYLYIDKKNKNELISEKYIQAGLYLSLDEKDKAKILLEEIIEKKNNFYSPLALNIIIERNLETDKDKILYFFRIIEDTKKDRNQNDLIQLKKALYLLQISEIEKGNEILRNLIKLDSNFKSVAEDIIKN